MKLNKVGFHKDILKDEGYKAQNNTENRIRYIVDNHYEENGLTHDFQERAQIVQRRRKSFTKSKVYYNIAKAKYNAQQDRPKKYYKSVWTNLNKAVLYAPHHKESNFQALMQAFNLRGMVYRNSEVDQRARNAKHISDLNDLLIPPQPQAEGLKIPVLVDQRNVLKVNDFCDFQESEEFGRFMGAGYEIQTDDQVVKEKVQYRVLLRNSLYKYCFNCFEPINISSAYPCKGCIDCIFCSQTCSHKANDSFHKFDCGIAGYLVEEYEDQWSLGYRALISLGYRNVRDLNTFINNNSGTFSMDRFILEQKQITGELTVDQNKEQFKAFLSLMDHIDDIPIDTMLSYLFSALEIALLIHQINVFEMVNDNDIILLAVMLLKFFCKTASNCYDINDINGQIKTGLCIAIVSAMFNHSCNPNTIWRVSNQYQVLTARRDIHTFEEITVSYGVYSDGEYAENLHERQHYLRDYYFSCNCRACSRDKRLFIPFRCGKCDGTVYYPKSDHPNAVNLFLRCVDCWKTNNKSEEKYQNQLNLVNTAKNKFDIIIDYVFSDITSLNDKLLALELSQDQLTKIELYVKPEWPIYQRMRAFVESGIVLINKIDLDIN